MNRTAITGVSFSRPSSRHHRKSKIGRAISQVLESRRYLSENPYDLPITQVQGTYEGDSCYIEVDFVNTPSDPYWITITSSTSAQMVYEENVEFTYYGDTATLPLWLVSDSEETMTVMFNDGNEEQTWYWEPTLQNVAPTASLTSNRTTAITGQTVSVALQGAYDPSGPDTSSGFTYSFDFNNDNDFDDPGESSGSSSSATYAFDTPGSKVIHGRIADKDGGSNDYSISIAVSDVAAQFSSDGPVSTNSTVTVKFTSPFTVDGPQSFTYSVDWDNNGTFEVSGSSSATASTTFGSTGSKVVRGRVTDSNSNTQDYFTTIEVTSSAPGTPTGLTATAVSEDRIDLTWHKTSTADGYYVDYSTASNFAGATTVDTQARVNKTSITGLNANTTYYFRIRSYNSAGSSSNSSSTNRNTLKEIVTREHRSTKLVRDVKSAPSANPDNFIAYNNLLFFSATDSTNGTELWKSDGTSTGTALVKDINSGSSSSSPSSFLVVGGWLYFVADNGSNGRELWRTNGTSTGTSMILDIRSGSDSSSPEALANINGTLYFAANNGSTGSELWLSNGDSTGTVLVRDINPTGSNSSSITGITYLAGKGAIFAATDGSNGIELWKSNGTSTGTVMIKDIYSGSSSSAPLHITALGSDVYFSAEDSGDGRELWKSNGDSTGTALLKDIMADDGATRSSNPKDFVVLSSKLYFTAEYEYSDQAYKNNNRELWVSNGTSSGTKLFSDLFSNESRSSNPTDITIADEFLVLTANEDIGRDMYFTNGDEGQSIVAGPGRVGKVDAPLTGYHVGADPTNYVGVDGALYYLANDLQHGYELYKIQSYFDSNLLLPTYMPRMLRDINPGSAGGLGATVDDARNRSMIAVGQIVFFVADDGEHGLELWRTNGTAAGTVLVKDINTGNSGSSGSELVNINGTLYFAADGYDVSGSAIGTELWKSDGTSAGTTLVRDILSGSGSSSPAYFTRLGNTSNFLFAANDGTNGYELWISDGTSGGTTMVKNIRASSTSSNPNDLFAITLGGTDYILFNADDGSNGVELWISNGTSTGTQLLKDINSGAGTSVPQEFTAMTVSGTQYAFFMAASASEGTELWRTDGTSTGTTLVKDIRSGASSSMGGDFEVMSVSGTPNLFFWANDGTNGYELWKSDGTSTGTQLVKDIYSGNNGSWNTLPSLTAIGSTLYFTANDGTNGTELWSSNGTSTGTAMLKNINSGSSSSSPANLTAVGSTLFFSATDGSNGIELWISNGTSTGTTLVKDINSGASNSSPANLINVDGRLYFAATDSGGTELWASDGTSTGTSIVSDIRSGASSSSPTSLTKVGDDKLFFLADDGSHGQELWLASAFQLEDESISTTVSSGADVSDRVISGFKVAHYYKQGTSTQQEFDSFTTSGGKWIWEDTTNDVRLIVAVSSDASSRGISVELDNYNGSGLVVTDIVFDLPEIIAYSNPNYRTLSARVGGIEHQWPTLGSLEKHSGWWMADNGPGAYSPIAAFYDTLTGNGAGIIAFNTVMDPTKIYWTATDRGIIPHVVVKPLNGKGKTGKYVLTQFVSDDMPSANAELYRTNFLSPLMDDLAIDETVYVKTPELWGYVNAEGTVPGPGSAGHWSEVVTEDQYDPDYPGGNQPDMSVIDAGVGGIWVWPATNTGKTHHEPYRIEFGWEEDFADVIGALGDNDLGVVINPYVSYDYDEDGVIVGNAIQRNLSDPLVQDALAAQRDHLDENGVTLAFWDTGMTPQRSNGTVEDWLYVLKSWANVGIHIAPEQGNDISSWITGANMNYPGAHDDRGTYGEESTTYYLWYGGNMAIANDVTPNSTQFIEATSDEAGGRQETEEGLKFWWDVAIENGMVPAIHFGQQRRVAAPTITDISFNAATSPDKVTVSFSRDVSVSIGVGDLLLENMLDGSSITLNSPSYDTGTNTATFGISSFSGTLPPGMYRITVVGGGINQGANSYNLYYWGENISSYFEV